MAESLDTLVADADRTAAAGEMQLPRTEPPVSLRLRDRRWSSLALQYALINLIAILIWAFTGAHTDDFWPKWVLLVTLIGYFRRLGRRSRRPDLPPRSGER